MGPGAEPAPDLEIRRAASRVPVAPLDSQRPLAEILKAPAPRRPMWADRYGPADMPPSAAEAEPMALPDRVVDAAPRASTLSDPFRTNALAAFRWPATAGVLAAELGGRDDAPADWIRMAASLRDQPAWTFEARPPTDESGLEALCRVYGPCRPSTGPPEAAVPLLDPLWWALFDALAVAEAQKEPLRGPDWWTERGGAGLLLSETGGYDFEEPSDRAFLTMDRGPLAGAAALLAEAVQAVDWQAVKAAGIELDLHTGAGRVRVTGPGDDVHPPESEPQLLFVDLGGDDVHLGPVGVGDAGVSVFVDRDGADLYAYPEALDAASTRMALEAKALRSGLPADADGRGPVFEAGVQVSRSFAARQGAGRMGIGLAFDLGGDDDTYVSLRASQGYGQFGVGLLYDDGGDDLYAADEASQGAAQYGIGLLMDVGPGSDRYLSVTKSQGHGFVGGAGILFDAGGDELYRCAPADPLRMPSPQQPDVNVSLCQGAGFGFRDAKPGRAASGGVGLLVDGRGRDRYEAGVYGQGVGYWQGIGVLVDRSGDDRYAGVRYVEGAGVHYGVGVLIDAGGDDHHGRGVVEASLGLGHDFGVGLLWDRSGADVYAAGSLSLGAATCGSVGLFWDEGGPDRYDAPAGSSGRAVPRGCEGHRALGVFVDFAGVDDYGEASRGDRMRWRRTPAALALGLGLDAPVRTSVAQQD